MTNPRPNQIDPSKDSTGKNRYRWTFKATVEVSDVWVADGFDLTQDRLDLLIENAVAHALSFANSSEYSASAKVLTAPDPISIRREQGFPDAF